MRSSPQNPPPFRARKTSKLQPSPKRPSTHSASSSPDAGSSRCVHWLLYLIQIHPQCCVQHELADNRKLWAASPELAAKHGLPQAIPAAFVLKTKAAPSTSPAKPLKKGPRTVHVCAVECFTPSLVTQPARTGARSQSDCWLGAPRCLSGAQRRGGQGLRRG